MNLNNRLTLYRDNIRKEKRCMVLFGLILIVLVSLHTLLQVPLIPMLLLGGVYPLIIFPFSIVSFFIDRYKLNALKESFSSGNKSDRNKKIVKITYFIVLMDAVIYSLALVISDISANHTDFATCTTGGLLLIVHFMLIGIIPIAIADIIQPGIGYKFLCWLRRPKIFLFA